MIDPKTPSAHQPSAPTDPRPAYERPRVTRKKAVTRATLFTGGNTPGPASAPPLVAEG